MYDEYIKIYAIFIPKTTKIPHQLIIEDYNNQV